MMRDSCLSHVEWFGNEKETVLCAVIVLREKND